MKYAAKVYSSDILVGYICANSMTILKRKASALCNKYYRAIDTIMLHRADGKEVDNLKVTRINKLSPDNKIVRGTWR